MNPQIPDSHIPDRGSLRGKQTGGPRISDVAFPSRITVIEHIIYNLKEGQPFSVQGKFARNQETDEQPFQRIMKIGSDWTKIEPNWIKVCGMMIVSNEEGKSLQRIPSMAERADINARIIEVYFGRPLSTVIVEPKVPKDQWDKRELLPKKEQVVLEPWAMLLLPPGESQRYTPADVGSIWLRCQVGTAKVIVTLIPG